MKQEKILVINPAARYGMTDRIAAKLAPFGAHGLDIVCETPPGRPHRPWKRSLRPGFDLPCGVATAQGEDRRT